MAVESHAIRNPNIQEDRLSANCHLQRCSFGVPSCALKVRSSTDMSEVIVLDNLFFASPLVEIILKNETTHIQASRAFIALGNQLALSSYTADLKTFNYDVRSQCNNITLGVFRLRIVKGSIFTYIWNTFARVDDEYVLEFICSNMNPVMVRNIWSVKGMDPWNSRIVSSDVNWVNMRSIYHGMGVNNIGVLAFSKLVGRILISLPHYYKERYFLAPMPAAFM